MDETKSGAKGKRLIFEGFILICSVLIALVLLQNAGIL